MKVSHSLQRRSGTFFCVSLFVLAGILVVRRITARPINYLSLASTVDDTAPGNGVYGAHNFRRLNRVITEYDAEVAARLAKLVDRKSTAADPELIRLIMDMLDPPSTHMVKMSRQLFSTPQSREVDQILRQKVLKHRSLPSVSSSVSILACK